MDEEIDLFEHYDTLPDEVKAVIDTYCFEDMTYENCATLVTELNKVGYTCDYYLQAEPFALKKL